MAEEKLPLFRDSEKSAKIFREVFAVVEKHDLTIEEASWLFSQLEYQLRGFHFIVPKE